MYSVLEEYNVLSRKKDIFPQKKHCFVLKEAMLFRDWNILLRY